MTKYNQISSVRTRKPRLRGDDKSWAVYKKKPLSLFTARGA